MQTHNQVYVAHDGSVDCDTSENHIRIARISNYLTMTTDISGAQSGVRNSVEVIRTGMEPTSEVARALFDGVRFL